METMQIILHITYDNDDPRQNSPDEWDYYSLFDLLPHEEVQLVESGIISHE